MGYDWDHIRTTGQELEYYAEHEGPSEVEEMLKALCLLSYYPEYMSKNLLSAVVKEMEEKLEVYKNNTTIETKTETYTRTVTELVWTNGG